MKYDAEVIFLDASDEVILKDTKRQEKTPFRDSILEAIALEKSQLSEIREMADLIIDTSSFTVHDLTRFFEEKFKGNVASKMSITIQSFGFKYGIPPDSDMVIDVRFLKIHILWKNYGVRLDWIRMYMNMFFLTKGSTHF